MLNCTFYTLLFLVKLYNNSMQFCWQYINNKWYYLDISEKIVTETRIQIENMQTSTQMGYN